MSVVYLWLERIGLGYAIPHFQAANITTPHQLAAIEMAEGAADRLNIVNGASAAYAASGSRMRARLRTPGMGREGANAQSLVVGGRQNKIAGSPLLHLLSLSHHHLPQRTTRSASGSSSTASARCVRRHTAAR